MKNTSILKRIMGLALSLALLVSMMPVLASEVYAAGAGETVHIYKADGSVALEDVDYTVDGGGVRYNLNTDNLRVTTNGFVVKACFALNSGVNKVTFEKCRVFVDDGYMIQGDEKNHDQTISIIGDCDFMCNSGSLAMLFDCSGSHELTFTSSDENNSLDIENYGQAIEVDGGNLNFAGEINARITGEWNGDFIEVGGDYKITDNADVKVICKGYHNANNGIVVEGDMLMDENSKLEVSAGATAITVDGDSLLVRENASLKARSYHYVVAKTNGEAEFDTTGRVELINYHSDGLLCKKLKMLNRDGTVLIRGTATTAIKFSNEADITLGNNVKMYGSTNLNEPENSITREFTDITWKIETFGEYHPYFVIDGVDTPIQAILIKGKNETSGGGGGSGGSTGGENINTGEIEKLKEDLASADAKINELDEQLQELVKNIMNAKTKFSKFKSVAKKKVSVKFNKIPGAQKYEIKYRQSGQKWKTLTTKKLAVKFKKLKSGKKFHAKVRGLYEKDSLKVISPWSKIKTIKVK